jgi:hypothetical protein
VSTHPPIGQKAVPPEKPPAKEVWTEVHGKPHLEENERGQWRTKDHLTPKPAP